MSQTSWIAPSQADNIRFSQEDFFNPLFQPIDPVALNFSEEKKEDIKSSSLRDPEQQEHATSRSEFKSSIVLDKPEEPQVKSLEQRNNAEKSKSSRFARPPEWKSKHAQSRAVGAFDKKNKARLEYSSGRWNRFQQGQSGGFSRQEQSEVAGTWRDNIPDCGYRGGAQDKAGARLWGQSGAQIEKQTPQQRPSDATSKQSCNNFVMRLDNQSRGAISSASAAQRTVHTNKRHSADLDTNSNSRKGVENISSLSSTWKWQQEMLAPGKGRGRGVKRGGGLASATREEIEQLKQQETIGIISELTERKLLLEEQLDKLEEENEKYKTKIMNTDAENRSVWQKLNDIESDVEGLRKEAFQAKDRLKVEGRRLKAKAEDYEKKWRLSEERAEKLKAANLEMKKSSAKLRRRVRELERAHLTGESLLEITLQVAGFSRNPSAEFAQWAASAGLTPFTPSHSYVYTRKKSNRRSATDSSKYSYPESEKKRGYGPLKEHTSSWTKHLSQLQQPNEVEAGELMRIGNVLAKNGIGCIGDPNKEDSDYCTSTPPMVDSPPE